MVWSVSGEGVRDQVSCLGGLTLGCKCDSSCSTASRRSSCRASSTGSQGVVWFSLQKGELWRLDHGPLESGVYECARRPGPLIDRDVVKVQTRERKVQASQRLPVSEVLEAK